MCPNPLSPELPQHGVFRPRAPRHNIIFNSFLLKFPSRYFSFTGINLKDLQAGISALREFVTVGEVGLLALWGERVKTTAEYWQ